jgi:hypothetical protein
MKRIKSATKRKPAQGAVQLRGGAHVERNHKERGTKKDGVQSPIATPLKPHHIHNNAIRPFILLCAIAESCGPPQFLCGSP